MVRWQLMLRRKRHLVVGSVVLCLVISIFALVTNMRQEYPLDIPSDYELTYADDSQVNNLAMSRKMKVILQPSDPEWPQVLNIDRKPQALNTWSAIQPKTPSSTPIDPNQPPYMHVIFNRDNPPVVPKRLAYLPQPKVDSDAKPDEDNYDADDDDDAEQKNDPIHKVVIEDDGGDDEENEPEEDDEYEYWAENPNPVFQPGDFDEGPTLSKPTLNYQEIASKPKDADSNHNNAIGGNDVKPISITRELQSKVISAHKSTNFQQSLNQSVIHKKNSTKKHKAINKSNLVNKHMSQEFQGMELAKGQSSKSRHALSDYGLQNGVPLRPKEQDKRQSDKGASIVTKHIEESNISPFHSAKGTMPQYEEPATQIQMPDLLRRSGVVKSNHGFLVVTDHLFWSPEVEQFVPKGVNESEVTGYIRKVQSTPIKAMHPPQWNRCGRPKNQYVLLTDGSALCARYRDPHNKLIQGEVLSFYLSRYLTLDNVPVVVLSEVNTSAAQWRGQDLHKADWDQGNVVALIQWVDGLEYERSRVKMPPVILSAYEKGALVTGHHPALPIMSPQELSELLQWGEMIIFDYITGHYDRVASMQDGADREKKPSILTESIRNLRKAWSSGKLWLIDNESGLLDAYSLLYHGKDTGRRFIEFHTRMLRTMCIFRKSVITQLEKLAAHSQPHKLLEEYTRAAQPLYQKLPYSREQELYKRYFHTRLKEVMDWVKECRTR